MERTDAYQVLAGLAQIDVVINNVNNRHVSFDTLDAVACGRVNARSCGRGSEVLDSEFRWNRLSTFKKLQKVLSTSFQANKEVRYVTTESDFLRQFHQLRLGYHQSCTDGATSSCRIAIEADVNLIDWLKLLCPLRAKRPGTAG